MKNSDRAAMPRVLQVNGKEVAKGLTKREHFAGLAMQGLLAGLNAKDEEHRWSESDFAGTAVSMADALLAELERTA